MNIESQKYFKGVGFVDYFLPDFNIIIECDEKHHSRGQQLKKDTQRDFSSMFLYQCKTLRFQEYDILNFPEKCVKEIERIMV